MPQEEAPKPSVPRSLFQSMSHDVVREAKATGCKLLNVKAIKRLHTVLLYGHQPKQRLVFVNQSMESCCTVKLV